MRSRKGRFSLISSRNVMSLQSHTIRVAAVTVSSRPARPRTGIDHTYVLNGSRLRDVLVDGRWLTVSVDKPKQSAH